MEPLKTSAEWIDPCARTDTALATVQTGAVCIGAARAKLGAAYTVASETALLDDAAANACLPQD